MDSSIQSGKVRVVARIRGFGDQNLSTAPSISVRKLQSKSSGTDRVLISFSGEQSLTSNKPFSYEVDHCYDHEARNDALFNEEIKPLISSVFEGKSATVFAYGARGSGKTYTIQGSDNVPGLMTLSMSEFLSRAEEVGNCISVSLYEVVQDHVFDLLDSKKSEISVLESAHGKVVLKGLSKVIVKSMSDFHKSCSAIIQRPLQKMPSEPPQRSHRGMAINVLSSLVDASLLGRMNLVDLAGYEDKRQSISGPNLIDISRINKSLYAVHNVLHALKSNETHVPYRESKLTRMLQGSLGGGMNKILMITCMDPSFSEDTIKALSLASRSCNAGNKTNVDHTSRVRSFIKPTMTPTSSTKQTAPLSSKTTKQTAPLSSKTMNVARLSVSASTRKQAKSLFHNTEKKPQDVKVQGRRLFKEQQSATTKKETIPKKTITVTESSRKHEGIKCVGNVSELSLVVSTDEGNDRVVNVTKPSSIAVSTDEGKKCVGNVSEPSLVVSTNEGDDCVVNVTEPSSIDVSIDEGKKCVGNVSELSPVVSTNEGDHCIVNVTEPSSIAMSTDEVSSLVEKTGVNTPSIQQPVSGVQIKQDILVSEAPVDHHIPETPDIDILQADKENKSSTLKEGASPPLSVRLQELSNSLKSLYTCTTPLNTKMEIENYNSIKGNDQLGNDLVEPSTPISQQTLTSNKKCQYSSVMSPWERLQIHSTGMKNSLAQECLKFFNTASKEELKGLKGIGDVRATYILELREESHEPFKSLDDLKGIGLSSKQINGMMRRLASGLFD